MSRPLRASLNAKSLSLIGIPKDMQEKTMKDFDTFQEESLESVKTCIEDYIINLDVQFEKNNGLFLYGSNGVGKTFIASTVIKEAYRRRYRSKRVSFADYVQEYTRVWQASSEEAREELEDSLYTNYKGVEFLALEEVGKEIDSKIAAPILEDLLRYREDKALPTIICTNLDIKDLADRYGNSITSLIKGNETPILIEGKDKRRMYFSDKTTK